MVKEVRAIRSKMEASRQENDSSDEMQCITAEEGNKERHDRCREGPNKVLGG